jgi:hypothetical protein
MANARSAAKFIVSPAEVIFASVIAARRVQFPMLSAHTPSPGAISTVSEASFTVKTAEGLDSIDCAIAKVQKIVNAATTKNRRLIERKLTLVQADVYLRITGFYLIT